MEPEPFFRQADNGAWIGHHHPYRDLPELECHIAPPYAVINAGPKCMNLDLDRVALDYHGSETSDSQRELKHRLGLLCEIWVLFENAKEAANAWGEKEREARRKRKRDEDDGDTASVTTKRTTRSQTRTANDGHDYPPSPSRPGSHASRQPGGSNANRRSSRVASKRKRKSGSSTSGATLTETAVWHLCKRQKMTDPNTTIKHWIESTYD